MGEEVSEPKCRICGAGIEGLIRYNSKIVLSECKFYPEMQCPECGRTATTFIHDDVCEGEMYQACGNCERVVRVGQDAGGRNQ